MGPVEVAQKAPEVEGVEIIPLSLASRCDGHASGCAQAFVELTRETQELLLCGHCANSHMPTLLGKGWSIRQDRREFMALAPNSCSTSS